MQLSKPHTFMFLFHYHLVPTKPIDSFSLWIRVPPKRIHHLLQFIFKSGRKQIDTHVISGYRLSNRFYKNLYTCFWELFCCPMANVILDFVLYKIEDHFFLFSNDWWKPQVFGGANCLHDPKEGRNIVSLLLMSVEVEEIFRFLKINNLTWNFSIFVNNLL